MSDLLVLNCKYCGVKLSPYAFSFCLSCGKSIEDSSQISTKLMTKFKKIIGLKNKDKDLRNIVEIITQNFDDKTATIGDTLIRFAQRSSSIPSSAINEIATSINGSLDKVPSVNEVLSKIVDSANDPKVVTVSKLLMKHSPKIAVAISAGIALAPGGVAVAPVAYPLFMKISEIVSKQISQQTSQLGSIEKPSSNSESSAQYSEIIGAVLGQVTQQIIQPQARDKRELLETKICIICKFTLAPEVNYCYNCGSKQN
jgi:hypothetical protein